VWKNKNFAVEKHSSFFFVENRPVFSTILSNAENLGTTGFSLLFHSFSPCDCFF